jgi:hypothetical protein
MIFKLDGRTPSWETANLAPASEFVITVKLE